MRRCCSSAWNRRWSRIRSGAEPVALDDLLAARPDPFWEMETAWLQHLDEDHRDLIDMLSRKLPPHMRRGRVRPLGIDRYGLRLRVENDHGDRDIGCRSPRRSTTPSR